MNDRGRNANVHARTHTHKRLVERENSVTYSLGDWYVVLEREEWSQEVFATPERDHEMARSSSLVSRLISGRVDWKQRSHKPCTEVWDVHVRSSSLTHCAY